MKLTVVNAGLILAILLVNYEPVLSRAVERLDRSVFDSKISDPGVVQGRQTSFSNDDDDYYEEEEYEEEADQELQQSLDEQQDGGGGQAGHGGGEEEEDDNEEEEGDEEEGDEYDDEAEQRFMENKKFLNGVYDIL